MNENEAMLEPLPCKKCDKVLAALVEAEKELLACKVKFSGLENSMCTEVERGAKWQQRISELEDVLREVLAPGPTEPGSYQYRGVLVGTLCKARRVLEGE